MKQQWQHGAGSSAERFLLWDTEKPISDKYARHIRPLVVPRFLILHVWDISNWLNLSYKSKSSSLSSKISWSQLKCVCTLDNKCLSGSSNCLTYQSNQMVRVCQPQQTPPLPTASEGLLRSPENRQHLVNKHIPEIISDIHTVHVWGWITHSSFSRYYPP